MPSLRRTMSSPIVRSSPYPSLSSAVSGGLASRGNGHRRSSASETNSRRVLADIEWWRVADGQRDIDADSEREDRNHDETLDQLVSQGLVTEELLGSRDVSHFDVGAEHPSLAMPLLPEESEETLRTLPTNQFAALSISPHSPPRWHHSRESSVSSSDSAPEPASCEGLRLWIPDTEQNFLEATLPSFPVLERGASCDGIPPPLFSLRAHSFSDFVSLKTDTARNYADFTVSPLSASPYLCN